MPTTKENQWLQIINEQQQSQLSIAEYCRQHGLNPQSFYARKSTLKFQGKLTQTESQFMQVATIRQQSVMPSIPLTLEVGDVKLHLTHDIDVNRLAAIVRAVQA
ncbi:hypothetical protein DS2_19101 [Catenovulum agarivorans DS-2]|uniref:Transposase n=1 Tax=Catenovulum agarivorans DS-2 TaxID=1328313 RepID=W7QRS7_9ALTE|nr:transposase [Catenovulum agarivorans]EWH08095.1 hypothetical protein DS2_19101 [Catenovulum agarivorans DS-2]